MRQIPPAAPGRVTWDVLGNRLEEEGR